jgi:hypothetical protein
LIQLLQQVRQSPTPLLGGTFYWHKVTSRRRQNKRRTSGEEGHSTCWCAPHPFREQKHNLNHTLHTDPDPVMQTQSPVAKAASPSSGQSTSKLETDIYQQDGDYIKDIEVNDLRNRYTLTKGPTQKMVNILDASAHWYS